MGFPVRRMIPVGEVARPVIEVGDDGVVAVSGVDARVRAELVRPDGLDRRGHLR
jgi:hypothetical protein